MKVFLVVIIVLLSAVCCEDGGRIVDSTLPSDSTFAFRIGTVESLYPGERCVIPIWIDRSWDHLEAFYLRVAWNPELLTLIDANGGLPTQCGWGYTLGNVHYDCGYDNVTSRGITGRSPSYYDRSDTLSPCTDFLGPPYEAVFLVFQATANPERAGEAAPVRFFWCACTDNSLIYRPRSGTSMRRYGASRHVVDGLAGVPAEWGPPEDSIPPFPTEEGVPDSCLDRYNGRMVRHVDFINGGVKLLTPHPPPSYGSAVIRPDHDYGLTDREENR